MLLILIVRRTECTSIAGFLPCRLRHSVTDVVLHHPRTSVLDGMVSMLVVMDFHSELIILLNVRSGLYTLQVVPPPRCAASMSCIYSASESETLEIEPSGQ
jgi:hypothetical protein